MRVWLGVFDQTRAPALRWRFDGEAREPEVIRALSSVRRDTQLASVEAARAFSGVFEFEVEAAERPAPHRIEVGIEGETAVLDARAIPCDIPTSLDDQLNVLLVSCYHWAED